jgi:hypothetical protein
MTESDNEEENAESLHKLLRCCRAPQIRIELANNVLLLEQAFESLVQNYLSSFPRSLLDDSVSDKISLAGPRPLYAQNRIRTCAWRNFWR